MGRNVRSLAMFTCITAAAAFGGQMAHAQTDGGDTAQVQTQHEHHHQHKQRCEKKRHHFFRKLARELGLTDKQKADAKVILKKNREQNKPLREALFKERRALRSLVMSGSSDEAAIRAQSAKVASVEADLAVRRAGGAKQLIALLTPDQVAKLKKLQEKWDRKFQERMSHQTAPETE